MRVKTRGIYVEFRARGSPTKLSGKQYLHDNDQIGADLKTSSSFAGQYGQWYRYTQSTVLFSSVPYTRAYIYCSADSSRWQRGPAVRHGASLLLIDVKQNRRRQRDAAEGQVIFGRKHSRPRSPDVPDAAMNLTRTTKWRLHEWARRVCAPPDDACRRTARLIFSRTAGRSVGKNNVRKRFLSDPFFPRRMINTCFSTVRHARRKREREVNQKDDGFTRLQNSNA